jgi:hypothetical protein
MSSYNSLHTHVKALGDQREEIEQMAIRLENGGYNAPAAATRQVLMLIDQADALAESLTDVWYTVEGRDNSRWGEQAVRDSVGEYHAPEAGEWAADWTINPETNRSNSSPLFLGLVQAVKDLINGGAGGFVLRPNWTGNMAGLIMAQLAHVHGLAPSDVRGRDSLKVRLYKDGVSLGAMSITPDASCKIDIEDADTMVVMLQERTAPDE